MLHSTKFSLVLPFQLNEQPKVQVVRVSGTECTVKSGLGLVQIISEILSL